MNRKEFYDSLSEDVKAKLKACKTEGEMLKVLEDEKIALDPELLDEASGGGVSDYGRCPQHCNNSRC